MQQIRTIRSEPFPNTPFKYLSAIYFIPLNVGDIISVDKSIFQISKIHPKNYRNFEISDLLVICSYIDTEESEHWLKFRFEVLKIVGNQRLCLGSKI
jgi:hypothetical protein